MFYGSVPSTEMSVTSETNSSGEDDLSDEEEELDPRIQVVNNFTQCD